MANSKLTITDLPDDLLCEIFDHLTVYWVLSIQTVNKDFNRCSKKWFSSVDELFIFKTAFALQKSFGGQPFRMRDDDFEKDEQTLLPSIERMLPAFTGIKNIEFYSKCASIGVSQLVQLISRCPNFKRFLLILEKPFTDDDWNSLVEVVKHFEVYLKVCCNQPSIINQLKQLFTTATKIKSVHFQESTDLFLKTNDFLNDSVRIEIDDYYFSKSIDNKQISDLVGRRVDYFETSLFNFKKLSCSRFSRLSDLHIYSLRRIRNILPFTSAIEFPRLQNLNISVRRNVDFVSSFLLSAQRLDQLKKLEFLLDNFVIEDQLLIDVLKKTPKITELYFSWGCDGEISTTETPAFEKLFQSLSQAPIRLQFMHVHMWLTKLTPDDFCPIIDCLFGFASKKITETKLKLIFCGAKGQVQSEFEEKITTALPRNVLIEWSFY